MPGFDGTGPFGVGAMTGGRRGYCNPNAAYPAGMPYGFRGPAGYGRGFGNFGRGMRRGFGARSAPASPYYPAGGYADPEGELEMLKAEAGMLKSSLDAISKRISELESSE